MAVNPYRLAAAMSRTSGDYVDVSFRSGSMRFKAVVPAHELFVSVKDVLVFEEYETDPRFKLSRLSAGATVLDVGAFVGLFSLKASAFARRVISLEPVPKSHALLVRNIKRNSASNIEARKLAVSSARSAVGFREMGSTSHIVDAGEPPSIFVPTVELRGLVDEVGTVDLLKLDVEGAESDIILNSDDSTLSRVNKIVAELHFPPLDGEKLRSIVSRLKRAGLRVGVFNKPIRGLAQGVAKPWSCPLSGLDERYAFFYRLFLSGVYALSPAWAASKSVKAAGELSILFARRE